MEVDVFGPGEVQNQFTVKTVRHNPAAVGAVTGNATYASFLSSLLGKNFIIFVMSSPGILTPSSGCFLVLWKPLLVHFCIVVWVLFSIISVFCIICVINHLSPNDDQHQFSPNNIHRLSRYWVMRVNKMII